MRSEVAHGAPGWGRERARKGVLFEILMVHLHEGKEVRSKEEQIEKEKPKIE
jgi:hypothetical protein